MLTECSVCGNKLGFTCGTCIRCGFNCLDNTFHHIEVSTCDLKSLVSSDVYAALVEKHRIKYKRSDKK